MKFGPSLVMLSLVVGCKGKQGDAPAVDLAVEGIAFEATAATAAKPHVVFGDGFSFEVPSNFKPVQDGAYTGTIEGAFTNAKLTLWATSEPFAGDVEALSARELAAASAAGASAPESLPTAATIEGATKQGVAKNMTIKSADRIEFRTLVVWDGKAYTHHCETPAVPRAWANIGMECIERAATFHVAPLRAP